MGNRYRFRLNSGSGVDANLIGWWKLNEGSGTSAADSSSGGTNTGTLTNGPTWGTGPNSTGDVVFDGTDDYIAILNESNFDRERTDAFSLSVWVKVNSAATGSRPVMNKQQTTGNQPGIDFKIDADNDRVRCFLVQSNAASVDATTAISSLSKNAWHLIAVTYDGSSNGTGLKVYIDNGASTAGSGTLTLSILNDNVLWLGRDSGFYFYGEMDDARFYTRELTSGEVGALYSGGAK